MTQFITIPGHNGETYHVRHFDIGLVKTEVDVRGSTILLTTYEDTPMTLTTPLEPAEIFALLKAADDEADRRFEKSLLIVDDKSPPPPNCWTKDIASG